MSIMSSGVYLGVLGGVPLAGSIIDSRGWGFGSNSMVVGSLLAVLMTVIVGFYFESKKAVRVRQIATAEE
ncbi:MAG: hypothetical protein AB2L09_07565 [Coriobacteriia bacterium]